MSYIQTKNQFISVKGNQIAYRELGKGNSDIPLVMLTHLAAVLDNWDPKLLDLIAVNHHIIVMDLPGVGASQGKVAGSELIIYPNAGHGSIFQYAEEFSETLLDFLDEE